MIKRFEIEVEKVSGYCACGYKEGEIIYCEGLNTPVTPFCGGAYAVLFPIQTALHSGAEFNFEQNPKSKTTKEYKQFKGLKKENLRDNMTNTELVLNMLAELSTKNILTDKNIHERNYTYCVMLAVFNYTCFC
jgi:uncharacterized repeat protein (TIGR04076 family)